MTVAAPARRLSDSDHRGRQKRCSGSALKAACRGFVRALNAPSGESFNPWSWIYLLAKAGVADVSHWTGCSGRKVKPCIPIFALGLIVLVVMSYFTTLRDSVLRERWCSSSPCSSRNTNVAADADNTSERRRPDDNEACGSSSTTERCYWMFLHDFLVVYFAIMILYHYVNATFRSPGVALPVINSNRDDDTAANHTMEWRAADGRGGFLGCNPTLDRDAEAKRVALYGDLKERLEEDGASSSSSGKHDFPSPYASKCDRCNILRPPRCHHCSQCDRCVLQFDHHCVWINNCVGLGNLRSFLLTLLYLMLGCWYGVALLFQAFYEPLKEQVRIHGFKWLYSNGTGFLDLPPPIKLARLIAARQVPAKSVVDMVYPLLLGVGLCMSAFVGVNLKYALKAVTSLEHRVILEQQYASLFGKDSGVSSSSSGSDSTASPPQFRNPFDQGSYKNFQQTFGPNPFLMFLPVQVTPPPPYCPDVSASKKNN